MKYVAGFMFDATNAEVALIEKQRPEWQKGRLNGIGGKIEEGETPHQAMVREFEEEAGLKTEESDWHLFCSLVGEDGSWQVDFFSCNSDIENLRNVLTQITDERLAIVPVKYIDNWNVMSNLKWLIPMGLDGHEQSSTVIHR